MTPEEVAQLLKTNLTWVYKHRQELGGVKLGGSLFFPKKEDLMKPEKPLCARSSVG